MPCLGLPASYSRTDEVGFAIRLTAERLALAELHRASLELKRHAPPVVPCLYTRTGGIDETRKAGPQPPPLLTNETSPFGARTHFTTS